MKAVCTHYGRGELPEDLTPGDGLLVYDHKPTTVHELIQARERQIAGKSGWADLTHMVCVADGSGRIIEANQPGVQEGHIEKYRDADFWLLHVVDATPAQRVLCVMRWEGAIGEGYNVTAFVGETLLAWGWPVGVTNVNGESICSGLWCWGALAWEVSFEISYQFMTPTHVALHYKLPIDEPVAPLSFTGRLLNRVVLVGTLLRRLVLRR